MSVARRTFLTAGLGGGALAAAGPARQPARGLTLLVPLLRRRKWAGRASERIADWAISEQRNPWAHAREASAILRPALADADEEVQGTIEYAIAVLSDPPPRDDEVDDDL